jgi:hypothetical protein
VHYTVVRGGQWQGKRFQAGHSTHRTIPLNSKHEVSHTQLTSPHQLHHTTSDHMSSIDIASITRHHITSHHRASDPLKHVVYATHHMHYDIVCSVLYAQYVIHQTYRTPCRYAIGAISHHQPCVVCSDSCSSFTQTCIEPLWYCRCPGCTIVAFGSPVKWDS